MFFQTLNINYFVITLNLYFKSTFQKQIDFNTHLIKYFVVKK